MADDEVVTNADNSQMLPLVMNWVKGHMTSAKDTLDRMTEDVSLVAWFEIAGPEVDLLIDLVFFFTSL